MIKKNSMSIRDGVICFLLFVFSITPFAASSVEPQDYPSLDNKQLGHIRHVVRLANQLPGEWSMMGSMEGTQEGDDALRYQLAYMTYALGLAHYHWLPAYRELYRDTSDKLIQKMLRTEVWNIWELTSKGSKVLDPDMTELGEGWIDPVVEGNTMYSGRLLVMVGMHTKLYADDKYQQPDSLTFNYEPFFRGLKEPQQFKYDFTSLTNVIYEQMVENEWLGLECEPNAYFVVCNQYPLVGFRFYDQVNGTNLAAGSKNYEEVWKEKGWVTNDKHMIIGWLIKQDHLLAEASAAIDSVTGLMMHSWNREFVQTLYPRQKETWIKKVSTDKASIDLNLYGARIGASGFASITAYASELGDIETKNALLNYADQYFKPTWDHGAFYYPRNDELFDENKNTVFVTRVAGNALFAYARLNPGDGMWKLYNEPWGDEHYSSPYISDVQYPEAQVTQAWYDQTKGALILKIIPGTDYPGPSSFYVNNLDSHGQYEIKHNGKIIGELKKGKFKALHENLPLFMNWTENNRAKIELNLNISHSIVIRDLSI